MKKTKPGCAIRESDSPEDWCDETWNDYNSSENSGIFSVGGDKLMEPIPSELIDPFASDSEDIDDTYDTPQISRDNLERVDSFGADRILKYCVIASLLLHIGVFAGVPRLMEMNHAKPLLNPGEKVTRVRLVEPQEEKKPEPPPETASAISDRDHTAVKERLPKAPPAQEQPIGRIEQQQKKMASLIPPQAPEDFNRQPEEKQQPEEKKEPKQKTGARKPPEQQELRPRKKENSQKRNVDLRPTPQDIAKGFSAAGSREFFPDGDVEEAIVDINTREDRFFSYLMHLKTKIQGVWTYPPAAARSGIGGTLTVEFSIAKTGELLEVNLLDSSGHTILDENAMRAIKTAAPYFPFPERMKAQRLRVRANFVYVTSNFFKNIM
jgi:protein TonB